MNMTMQVVPDGVEGIVDLDIVAAGMSRNSGAIRALTRKFTADTNNLREGIKVLDACGAIDLKTAITLHQIHLVIDIAVYEYLVHQLTVEAI